MRAPLAFGAKLVAAVAVCVALFFAAHSVNGRPEPEIHTVQNLALALLGTWASLAVAAQTRLSGWLWRAGAILALLAPAALAVIQSTQTGTLQGIGWAVAVLCFAAFGHGAGAMARDWPQSLVDEDPLRRIATAAIATGATAVVVRLLVAPLPDAQAVTWAAGGAAVAGVAMAVAAPALSARTRGRLTLQGIGVAACLLVLFAVFSRRGNPLMVWGPLLFLPSYAEARWRPARGADAGGLLR